MRKIICTLLVVIFAMASFGCTSRKDKKITDNTVTDEPCEIQACEITGEDVFDTGYYRFQFQYNGAVDPDTERTMVSLYFNLKNDTEDKWEIYVSNDEITEEDYGVLEYRNPNVINEGQVEVFSGQWIYVHCNHNSSSYEEPSKGNLSATYFKETGRSIDLSVEQEYYDNRNKGMYDTSFMDPDYILCDVTGDGNWDLCECFMTGSGMVRTICTVYDPIAHKSYCLDGYNYSYGIRCVKDGHLVVVESGPYGYGDPIVETTGTIAIEDDLLVFVPDET